MRAQGIVDDEGFGLAEILVAMMMLALLALAALPLLIGGIRLSANDSSITTATGIVSEQMTLARSQNATCSALTAFAGAPGAPVTDGAGRALLPVRTLDCPPTYPGTARFTVSVTAAGAVLASATTLIYVSGS